MVSDRGGVATTPASKLGLAPQWIVQEFGYDDDVDFPLREAIAELTGTELVDEDFDDVCDAVIAWWRADDGDTTDLTELMVDTLTVLDDSGLVWLFTPKAGRQGHVRQDVITEAAQTAGLHATTSFAIAPDWTATKLATARSRAGR